jgi:hypothetical protein
MALFGSEKRFQFQDEDEILRTLCSRQHWNQVRPEVLRTLIHNTRDDVLKISRLVFVSEYFDCVKSTFVDLSTIWEDPRLALSAFATTLAGLASDTIRHLGEFAEGSERQSQAMVMIETAFLSALVCDPYMLNAYRGLASFYLATGKRDSAGNMCRKYDETEQALLSARDEYAQQYRRAKYESVAPGMRAEIDRLKAQLGAAR